MKKLVRNRWKVVHFFRFFQKLLFFLSIVIFFLKNNQLIL